jgi:hypothetical protein
MIPFHHQLHISPDPKPPTAKAPRPPGLGNLFGERNKNFQDARTVVFRTPTLKVNHHILGDLGV